MLADDATRTIFCEGCKAAGVITSHSASGYLRKICEKCNGWGKLPSSELPRVADGPLVFRLVAGKPWSAHQELRELFSQTFGEVRICDPYCGPGTLERLHLLKHCSRIMFLTRSDENSYHRLMNDFCQEHSGTEFRRVRDKSIHDRYVLDNDVLILLGHGLKDVGKKDSFVIKLDRGIAGEMIESVRQSFDEKWQNAELIALK